MEIGSVVEYIDRQKIVCAVILEIKNNRLRLLNEGNREVNLSAGRILHSCLNGLDLTVGRDGLVEALKSKVARRNMLMEQVRIRDLWEVLKSEQEWIDLETMTGFCFSDAAGADHSSAVVRAFFNNKTYFKFGNDRFFPFSESQVDQILARVRETERKNRIIRDGGNRLKRRLDGLETADDPEWEEAVGILKSVCLFEKESPHYTLGKAILAQAGLNTTNGLFPLLVKLGIFDENENIDLYRLHVPAEPLDDLPERSGIATRTDDFGGAGERTDLTHLHLMTIDGQSTLDFDDALSIERSDGECLLGIHIADVGHFVKTDDPIDRVALSRGSSIYMPDMKIPMLPPPLAEGLCSLKAGERRPAITLMVRLTPSAEILGYDIFPSVIRVAEQLTYYDVNLTVEERPEIKLLHDIAVCFRERRRAAGAIQISLPDINIWIDRDGGIKINRVNRESPGRKLVSETMIMANWLMGRFLTENGMPAIFRAQQPPRERLFKDTEGTLFQNWMQRKLLSRFSLSHAAEPHAGLGLDAYVTSTSPIRKYFDLVTQRQIRAVLGLERPRTADEIDRVIQSLEEPMSRVSRIQYRRHRYWLMKYLEGRIGEKEEAIVLHKKKNGYAILLSAYMLECDLPMPEGVRLKAEDLIQVTIQHINARKDMIAVFLG
jgi:exoribonuclease II